MRITIAEFIRRFLLHVLPNGFHRIRSYGLLANGHRADELALCRSLLYVPCTPVDRNDDDDNDPCTPNHEPPPCPCCGGRMKIIETFNGPSPGRITSAGLTLCNQEYCVIARPHNSRTDNPPCLRPRLRVGGYPICCLVFVPSIRQNCDS